VSTAHTDLVLTEVAAERYRQVEKWGPQLLADNDGTDDGTMLLGRPYAVWENILKARCDHLRAEWKAGRGDPRNMTVALLEEVFEALAQAVAGDPEKLREELLQVAALCVKWAEIIDHRAATEAIDEALADRADEEIDRVTAGLYAATGRVSMRRGLNGDENRALRAKSRKTGKTPVADIPTPEGLL
jgi:NTP pyrophosphatase (non-canonical NTP hydrolase)